MVSSTKKQSMSCNTSPAAMQICALREIVEVKKKYGVYLYLDEAHSIGALGRTGRGVCEHLSVPFADVDILMGTFTKSFGSCGGYIASTAAVIAHLRAHCPAHLMVWHLSPALLLTIINVLSMLLFLSGEVHGANSNKCRLVQVWSKTYGA
jgi:serine palmitoyltransferase